jgi:hypothetical protein
VGRQNPKNRAPSGHCHHFIDWSWDFVMCITLAGTTKILPAMMNPAQVGV